jgi:uncharacterized protein
MGVMRADSPGLVRAAIEKGIVLFDTAHSYQRGKNEEMLGGVFKDFRRDAIVIGTKVPWGERGQSAANSGAGAAFLEKVGISLERLHTEYVDILYVHGLQSREDVLREETLEALTAAKKSGKTRFVGVSTHKNEPEVIRAAIECGVYDVVLTSINFKQDHYKEMQEAIREAAKAGIGVIGMKTMAGGYLDKERTKPINCKAALKFVLQDPALCTTIPGISTFDQLDDNITVNTDMTLSAEEKADLEMAQLQGGLYCQGCASCVPQCPRHLPIPELMRSYMYGFGYKDPLAARALLQDCGVQSDPCTGCGTCAVHCTRGFSVREKIADIMPAMSIPEGLLA